MIEWKDKNGKTILRKSHFNVESCSFCKKEKIDSIFFEFFIVDSFMKAPRKILICEHCLKINEFYYLDRNLNITYNFLQTTKKTSLFEELEKQKGQE